jgi:benzoylformate decarboxylase
VFLSLPGDVLDAAAALDLGRPTRVESGVRPVDEVLARLAARLRQARRPVLIAGHELATRDALAEAAELAEVLGIPVLQQTVPYAAHFRSEHPAFLGALTRNQQQVRAALEPYDLLVFLGGDVLRMSVHSPVDPMPPGRAVIQIAERDWELGKNYPAELAVRADVKATLRALVDHLRATQDAAEAAAARSRLDALAADNWSARRVALAARAEAVSDRSPLEPLFLTRVLADAIPADAVVLEEALSTGFPLPGFLRLRDAQGFYGLASGGIGFAMGGAVGVSLALPQRPVVALVGDGSAMYSIQALWTAAHLRRPITYVIANNRSYRILKERLQSFRRTDTFIGMDLRDPPLDFVAMARSMGVQARRVESPADFEPALREAVASGEPRLLDVAVADGYGG